MGPWRGRLQHRTLQASRRNRNDSKSAQTDIGHLRSDRKGPETSTADASQPHAAKNTGVNPCLLYALWKGRGASPRSLGR